MSKKTTNKKIKMHPEDYKLMINFIDHVVFKKKENINLEISARYVAESIKINPNQTNGRLSRAFRKLLDSRRVVIG